VHFVSCTRSSGFKRPIIGPPKRPYSSNRTSHRSTTQNLRSPTIFYNTFRLVQACFLLNKRRNVLRLERWRHHYRRQYPPRNHPSSQLGNCRPRNFYFYFIFLVLHREIQSSSGHRRLLPEVRLPFSQSCLLRFPQWFRKRHTSPSFFWLSLAKEALALVMVESFL
jgi:hypothetical protein